MTLLITFCGGSVGNGGSNSVDTSALSPAANVAPTITAQSAQSFEEQTDYNLAVTATDSDGSIASYEWTQL